MQGPPVLSACVHANLTKTRATVGVSGALARSGEVTPARRVFLWPLFQRRGSGLTCAEGSPNGRDSTVSTHPAPDSDTQRCSLSLSVSISLSPWQRFSAALLASLCSAPSLQQVSHYPKVTCPWFVLLFLAEVSGQVSQRWGWEHEVK